MSEAGIIRTQKDRDHPYVILNKSFANDERLSWEARGVLAYLFCKPDNWQVKVGDLANRGPAGRDKMYRIMRELESFGYLKRTIDRDEGQRFTRQVTTVYETPQEPDNGIPETEKPLTENPEAETPLTEKPYLNDYREESINDLNEGAPAAQTAPTAKSKQAAGTRFDIDTIPDEWRAYADEHYPDLDVGHIFDVFADYWRAVPGAKGRKADWRATWRNWVRREYESGRSRKRPTVQDQPKHHVIKPREGTPLNDAQRTWLRKQVFADRPPTDLPLMQHCLRFDMLRPEYAERLQALGLPSGE